MTKPASARRRRLHSIVAGAAASAGQAREVAPPAVRAEKDRSQFRFKLLDRSRQRGLGDVAFVRGTGEVQQPRNSEQIPDLMHFHDRAALSGSAQTTRMATVRTPEPR